MTGTIDEKLSQTAFGARLEMSRQRVSRFVRDGVLPTTADGKIPWLDGVRALISHLSETAAGRGGGSAQVDLSKERALLARAQREAVELKNAISRGEYLLAKDVGTHWDSMCAMMRSRLLAIPSQLPLELPHLSRHDLDAIDRAIRDALTELADSIDAAGQANPAMNHEA